TLPIRILLLTQFERQNDWSHPASPLPTGAASESCTTLAAHSSNGGSVRRALIATRRPLSPGLQWSRDALDRGTSTLESSQLLHRVLRRAILFVPAEDC